jgi:hypothetical protein
MGRILKEPFEAQLDLGWTKLEEALVWLGQITH